MDNSPYYFGYCIKCKKWKPLKNGYCIECYNEFGNLNSIEELFGDIFKGDIFKGDNNEKT